MIVSSRVSSLLHGKKTEESKRKSKQVSKEEDMISLYDLIFVAYKQAKAKVCTCARGMSSANHKKINFARKQQQHTHQKEK